MSDEKKSFFASLEPKSALIVGLVAGVLVICTIGFVIMLGVYFSKSGGKAGVGLASNSTPAAAANNQAQQPEPTPSVTKSDKPVVELFVMAYCPYGLQMEKAFAPVMQLLGSKADMSIKFVSYAMHGKKELDENTRQYCIETGQPTKYLAYLNCFFTAGQNDGTEAKYQQCLSSAGVNESALNSCVSKTDKTYSITAKFNDQSTWLSGQYPVYLVDQSLNDKYGVQGSPTLVINGAQVEASRSPEAVKQVVCAAFNNAPAECSQTLATTGSSAGFGAGAASGNTVDAACGN